MRLIERVLGSRLDDALHRRLHRLEHRGSIDRLIVESRDIQRRRFRAVSANGEDVAVALAREQTLFDGAVLACDEHYALVVEVPQTRWLRCRAHDAASALELGYNAGNLHWRVKFEGSLLLVAQEAPEETYRARLRRMLETGAVTIEAPPEPATC